MRILVLSFCFEPDLTAGSFKNSSLVKYLSIKGGGDVKIDVLTTMPNKFKDFKTQAKAFEEKENVRIWRINVPLHNTGFFDRIWTYKSYYLGAHRILKQNGNKYDLVYASTSRLFTGYLGARIAKKQGVSFYLDVRDIFVDTLNSVIKNKLFTIILTPFLKFIESYTIRTADHLNLVSPGFTDYFSKYHLRNVSYHMNGVDEEFILGDFKKNDSNDQFRIITYAGNIGEGQGLEKIIPKLAFKTKEKYYFRIIGGGGRKNRLLKEIENYKLNNVELIEPVDRKQLIEYYKETDFLLLHLNDYEAFKKVLPSKIFEYAATGKPIIAGLSGFSKTFIQENIDNVIFFRQCDHEDLIDKLEHYEYTTSERSQFIKKFSRDSILKSMSESVINSVKIN